MKKNISNSVYDKIEKIDSHLSLIGFDSNRSSQNKSMNKISSPEKSDNEGKQLLKFQMRKTRRKAP